MISASRYKFGAKMSRAEKLKKPDQCQEVNKEWITRERRVGD